MHDIASPCAIESLSRPEDVPARRTLKLRPQPPTIALFRRHGQERLLQTCFAHVRGYQFAWGQVLEFLHDGAYSWEFCLDGVLTTLTLEGWSLPDLIKAMQVVMRNATPRYLELSEGYHPATTMCLEASGGAVEGQARAWLAGAFLPHLSRVMEAGILPDLLRSARRIEPKAGNPQPVRQSLPAGAASVP